MFNDNKKTLQNDNNVKIIEKDGFKFVDDNDDEPIILYENHISVDKIADYENYKTNDNNSTIKNDDDIEQKNLFNISLIDDDNSELIKSNNSLDENDINFDTNNGQKDEIHKELSNNIEINNNQITDQNLDNDVEEIDIFSIEQSNEDDHNKTNQLIYEEDKVFLKPENKQINNLNHNEIDNNVVHEKNNDSIEENYFIKPTKKDANGKIQSNNEFDEEKNINKSFFSTYVVISSTSIKKLFKIKFSFNIVCLILWLLTLILVGTILFLGVNSKLNPNAKFQFSNYDFIPTVLFTIICFSFSIYHFVNIWKFKIAKNELNYNKKVDEIDYSKVTKIYKHNKKFTGIVSWMLLTISVLFAYSILFIYCIHKFNNQISNNTHLLKIIFYSSVATYIFLMIVMFIYLIAMIIMSKLIERDEYFKLNKTISKYKELNKRSKKIGLIIFLSSTIIGVIIYGIIVGIIKNKKENECRKHLGTLYGG